jgi:putative sterol carrier protein
MGELIDKAVALLASRMAGGFDGLAKFVIEGEGAIMLDADGVRAGDHPADVTLTATADDFQAMLAGELSPTMAFMSGKLSVDGDMGLAMKLGAALG